MKRAPGPGGERGREGERGGGREREREREREGEGEGEGEGEKERERERERERRAPDNCGISRYPTPSKAAQHVYSIILLWTCAFSVSVIYTCI